MVLEMVLDLYARNGVDPQEPQTEYRGVVVLKPDSCGQADNDFSSAICDCGPNGCCST